MTNQQDQDNLVHNSARVYRGWRRRIYQLSIPYLIALLLVFPFFFLVHINTAIDMRLATWRVRLVLDGEPNSEFLTTDKPSKFVLSRIVGLIDQKRVDLCEAGTIETCLALQKHAAEGVHFVAKPHEQFSSAIVDSGIVRRVVVPPGTTITLERVPGEIGSHIVRLKPPTSVDRIVVTISLPEPDSCLKLYTGAKLVANGPLNSQCVETRTDVVAISGQTGLGIEFVGDLSVGNIGRDIPVSTVDLTALLNGKRVSSVISGENTEIDIVTPPNKRRISLAPADFVHASFKGTAYVPYISVNKDIRMRVVAESAQIRYGPAGALQDSRPRVFDWLADKYPLSMIVNLVTAIGAIVVVVFGWRTGKDEGRCD